LGRQLAHRDRTDAEWAALRDSVRNSYQSTLRCLADLQNLDVQKVGMAIGMVAHTAYHLGAIRQIVKSTQTVSKRRRGRE